MSILQAERELRPAQVEAELRELVRRHKVYWEVRPEVVLGPGDKVVKTGFQIGLRGTFEEDHPLAAGDPECVEVYRDLRKVAEGILPAGEVEGNYHIGVYENAIEYTPSSGRKDIEVTIKIVSRESRHHVDESELQTLREMKQRLRDLGAPRGRWRQRTSDRTG